MTSKGFLGGVAMCQGGWRFGVGFPRQLSAWVRLSVAIFCPSEEVFLSSPALRVAAGDDPLMVEAKACQMPRAVGKDWEPWGVVSHNIQESA